MVKHLNYTLPTVGSCVQCQAPPAATVAVAAGWRSPQRLARGRGQVEVEKRNRLAIRYSTSTVQVADTVRVSPSWG